MAWKDGEWVDEDAPSGDYSSESDYLGEAAGSGQGEDWSPDGRNYDQGQYETYLPDSQSEHQNGPGENAAPRNQSEEAHTNDNRNYEQELKDQLGDLYTPGALEELKHRDYDQGWMDRIVNKEKLRADNEVGSEYHENGQGGYLTPPKKPVQIKSSNLSSAMTNGSGSGSSSGPFGDVPRDDVWKQLQGLFPNGMFNQGLVTARTSNVADALNRQKKSQTANNEAYLAEHGLIGSGPQATAAGNVEDRLNQNFNSSVNDIYSDESRNADNRMMQALQMATGMSEQEASLAVDRYRAQTEHDLGFGNLALGQGRLNLDTELGRGRLGLDSMLGQGNLALGNLHESNTNNQFYDQLQQAADSGNMDQLIELIKIMMSGANTSAGGYY